MARKLRFDYEGAIQHAYARGNERKEIFRCDDDRLIFLNLLMETAKRYEWRIYSYCLMNNHFHLAIQTMKATLSRGMHWLNGVYSQKINHKYGRVGHLLQGRFKNTLVQSGPHLARLNRYIMLNPVRAELVRRPEDWAWSSYTAIMGLAEPQVNLDIDGTLAEFGGVTDAGRDNFKDYVLSAIGQEPDQIYKPILGNNDFVREQVADLSEKEQIMYLRPKLSEIIDPRLDDCFIKENLTERNSQVLAAVQKYHYKQAEVAKYLGMSRTGVHKIIQGG